MSLLGDTVSRGVDQRQMDEDDLVQGGNGERSHLKEEEVLVQVQEREEHHHLLAVVDEDDGDQPVQP